MASDHEKISGGFNDTTKGIDYYPGKIVDLSFVQPDDTLVLSGERSIVLHASGRSLHGIGPDSSIPYSHPVGTLHGAIPDEVAGLGTFELSQTNGLRSRVGTFLLGRAVEFVRPAKPPDIFAVVHTTDFPIDEIEVHRRDEFIAGSPLDPTFASRQLHRLRMSSVSNLAANLNLVFGDSRVPQQDIQLEQELLFNHRGAAVSFHQHPLSQELTILEQAGRWMRIFYSPHTDVLKVSIATTKVNAKEIISEGGAPPQASDLIRSGVEVSTFTTDGPGDIDATQVSIPKDKLVSSASALSSLRPDQLIRLARLTVNVDPSGISLSQGSLFVHTLHDVVPTQADDIVSSITGKPNRYGGCDIQIGKNTIWSDPRIDHRIQQVTAALLR